MICSTWAARRTAGSASGFPRREPIMDDRQITESAPLPLARAFRRYWNSAGDRERHDAAYFLFEIYLKYAASIAIARYLAGESGSLSEADVRPLGCARSGQEARVVPRRPRFERAFQPGDPRRHPRLARPLPRAGGQVAVTAAGTCTRRL